jgi:uncharacterized protein (DUF924 family)
MHSGNDLLVHDLLTTWFGTQGDSDYGQFREIWFQQKDDFDAQIAARFTQAQASAATGALDFLADTAPGALALVLLLDQLPRNIHRGTPEAFVSDAKARVITNAAIAQGFDQALLPVQRLFLYLPFMHSEERGDQERSVALCQSLGADFGNTLAYAEHHRDIIRRFGRFPHRNLILGRASTAEEEAFLKTPGSSY